MDSICPQLSDPRSRQGQGGPLSPFLCPESQPRKSKPPGDTESFPHHLASNQPGHKDQSYGMYIVSAGGGLPYKTGLDEGEVVGGGGCRGGVVGGLRLVWLRSRGSAGEGAYTNGWAGTFGPCRKLAAGGPTVWLGRRTRGAPHFEARLGSSPGQLVWAHVGHNSPGELTGVGGGGRALVAR